MGVSKVRRYMDLLIFLNSNNVREHIIIIVVMAILNLAGEHKNRKNINHSIGQSLVMKMIHPLKMWMSIEKSSSFVQRLLGLI